MDDERPPLRLGDQRNGLLVGYVGYPLSRRERDGGKLGWEAEEWQQIATTKNARPRYPLRDEHKHDIGHLVRTTVAQDHRNGRPILGVEAQIDMSSDAGRAAYRKIEDGRCGFMSWRFDAYEPSEPTSRRYKNRLVEVSITDDPANREAAINVICSKRAAAAMSNTEATNATPSSPAEPAAESASATQQTSAGNSAAMTDYVRQAAAMSADEILKTGAADRLAAQAAAQRLAEVSEAMKRQEAELAEFRRQRAEAERAEAERIRKQIDQDLPMLQKAGWEIDDQTQEVLTAAATTSRAQPMYQNMVRMARELAEAREAAARADAEARRNNTLLRLQLGQVAPAQQQAAPTRRARAEAEEQTRAVARNAANDQAMDLLGLSKLDQAKFREVMLTNRTPLAPQQAAAASAVPEADDQPPELKLSDNITEYFAQLRDLMALGSAGQHAPVPVACSFTKRVSKPVDVPVPVRGQMVNVPVPWYVSEFYIGRQDEIDAHISGKDHQEWNYTRDGIKSLAKSIGVPNDVLSSWSQGMF